MKTLKSFLVLIAILFVACLFTGCTTTGLDTKEKRCTAYSDAYSLYLATAEIREVSKDEKAAASAAAIFLRTWCGWTAPKGGPSGTVDKNGVEIVYPPKPKARSSRNSAAPAMRAGPVPVGPPAPGRTMAVPLEWNHNPLADQAREYWLYWARSTNAWDARITLPTASGPAYRWTTSQAGFARFAVTAARPPNASLGEKEWVESDPSNELDLIVSGFPNKPDRLRPAQP